MKKKISVILIAACLLVTAGCGQAKNENTAPDETSVSETAAAVSAKANGTVTEDTKYHAAIFSVSPEDFEAAGFTLGDSCNVVFDSGLTIDDVPFYNGYYVKNGDPVIVAYPNDGCVKITYNNEGIWSKAGLSEGDGVTITLNEKGKYSPIQESLGQVYSTDRADYDSDESFCNFRAMTGGNLKENFFFRGASPVDNSRGRAAYTSALLEKNGIKFILDLADSDDDIKEYIASADFSSAYAKEIYEDGNMALLDMGSGFTTDEYKQKLVSGLRQMMNSEGPVYIHCMEGKDRTGFVCFLIEALAGADYDEMQKDYMTTYKNYYGVTQDGTQEKYDAIAALYFDSFAECLQGTDDVNTLKSADYTQAAADYLTAGGMTADEVAALTAYISE